MKLNIPILSTNILLLVLFLPIYSFGQKDLPGGVAGLRHWFTISESAEEGRIWSDQVGKATSITLAEDQYDFLNGHPVLQLKQNGEAISLPLASSILDKSTIISLYQALDTVLEQVIWRIAKPNQAGLVLSTYRLGDVTNGRYFNTSTQRVLHPVLHTYVQHDRSKTNTAAAQWSLGHTGGMENLPLVPFAGYVPELLMYDRVLTQEEQLRVNSHFAIQYGLTLPKSNYLNASGKVIWDFKENQEFPYHIAGLTHDPVSGLHQKQSSSQMSEENLIELSAAHWASTNEANSAEIPAGVSLIWSDNGERLRFLQDDTQQIMPPLLERKWLMDASEGGHQLITSLRLHVRNLEKLLAPSEEVWLAVDESGTGRFAYTDTRYYPGRKGDGELLTFTGLQWDVDQSGKDVFSFVLGRPMIPVIGLEEPQCSPEKEAILHMRMHGGTAPYNIQWINKETLQTRTWEIEADQDFTWFEPRTGFFELHITDANGDRVQRSISIQNQDAPSIPLLPSYTLPLNEPLILTLDGASQADSAFKWMKADGSLSRSSSLSITEPGSYRLWVEANGCAREHRFQVLAAPTNFLEEWQLFPNPIGVNEQFELRFSLHQPQAIEVFLIDGSGRVISSEKRLASVFQTYQNRMQSPGLYQIVVRNGSDQVRLPVVVQ